MWQSTVALGTSPGELTGTIKEPVRPGLIHASVSTGCVCQRNAQASGQPWGGFWGTTQCGGWRGSAAGAAARHLPQPISRPPPRDSAGVWQHPSAQCRASGRWERGLSLALSMSGAEALGAPGPEGAGAGVEDVPSLKEIEQLLNTGRSSCNHVDEVWPNLFLGDL